MFALRHGVSPSSYMTNSCAVGSVPRKQLQHTSAVVLLTTVCELSLAGMHSMLNLIDGLLLKVSKQHNVVHASHTMISTQQPSTCFQQSLCF